MPYSFLDDISTADIAFEAWGGTREEMFAAGAEALLATMTDAPEGVGRVREVAVSLGHEELDLLLFAFLQELIFHKDADRLLLHADVVSIEENGGGYRLLARCRGEEIDAARHRLRVDVKAVTLHCFRVECLDGRWMARVVLDV